MTADRLACLVLAGGKGTRMRSRTPKLLHHACGRPLLAWPLAAIAGLGARPAVVIVPPGSDEIAALVPEWAQTAVQSEPRGTGDAVAAAHDALSGFDGEVLVLNGDHPLIDSATLRELVEAHRASGSAATVLSIDRTETVGRDFGRIVRDAGGGFERIVEVRDASPAELALQEVNCGYYVFAADRLWSALERLTAHNDQGELYLTDVIGILAGDGQRVHAHPHADPSVAMGINSRVDLAEADAELRRRILRDHMLAGVTVVDPATTFVEAGVVIEPDVTLQPFTVLRGATVVRSGAAVGPHVVAVDATIGAGATVGPFCYLRPGAVLEQASKAGTFVEIKNSVVGEGAKVPHLSYIGDAQIGAGTNIGAGNITANYDGTRKQPTVIGRDVRTGSDNVFVAPVTIGDGAWTGAGSTITDDVPPEALGVARAKQTIIEGYARRRRR